MGRLGKLLALPWPERGLFFEALLMTTLAHLLVRALPFRRLAPLVGRPMLESSRIQSPEAEERAHAVARALARVDRHAPWPSTCLSLAVAGMWILKRRGQEATLYLGVLRGADGMSAHAWLRSGEVVLSGRRGHRRHVVVGTFQG